MNAELIILAVLVLVVVALILVSKKWGRAQADAELAQANQKTMERYEKIDSQSNVDDPFDELRDK
jgi:hypothetical protein